MIKSKKHIGIIIAMILVFAMLGSSFAFADDMDGDTRFQEQGTEENMTENEGTRSWVTTYYNANGGTCGTSYSSNQYGQPYGTMPVPTRDGYVFVGWFESANVEDYEFTANTPARATTLYAHWAKYHIVWNIGALKALNIYGTNIITLSDHMNVTMWQSTGSNEQVWLIPHVVTYPFYCKSSVDRNFGLNVYRSGSPWNCDIHEVIGNETDALVELDVLNDGNFLMKLSNYSLYLTAGGSANGSNVYWDSYSSSNYQKWN